MDLEKITAYTKALSENNNRTWFHDNHREYEAARDEFLALLDVVKFAIMKEAPGLGDLIEFTDPKLFMYRIPRDMRYSRESEPYNPAFRAYFSPIKKNFLPLSYFLYLDHTRCSLGTGVYPWEQSQLNTLRDYVARNYEELDGIVWEGGFELRGKTMKRVPKGFEPDHPAAEWLKHKYFTADYRFSPEEMSSAESFAEAASEVVRRFEPMRKYFAEAFEAPDEDEEDWY